MPTLWAAQLAAIAIAAASPSTPLADAAPIRTVVYKISQQQTNNAYMERYNDFQRLHAIVPSDSGTSTIDVMVHTPEALGIRVTELTRQRGYPAVFTGNVSANGAVSFPESSISDPTFFLLRFFAEDFASDRALKTGDIWKTSAGEIAVRKSDGKLVTLEITESFKVPEATSDLFIHGTIVYEPGLLVPISGDIIRKRVENHPEGTIELTETCHFERTSDTFEPVPR